MGLLGLLLGPVKSQVFHKQCNIVNYMTINREYQSHALVLLSESGGVTHPLVTMSTTFWENLGRVTTPSFAFLT